MRARCPAQMEVRKEGQRVRCLRSGFLHLLANKLELKFQRLHTANFHHRNPGQHHHHRHLQSKLEEVCNQHAPQSADGRVNAGKRNQHKNADQQCGMAGRAQRVMQKGVTAERELQDLALRNERPKQNSDNADHGIRNPAQDQAIHRQAKIDGLESAKKSRWLTAIANLSEFHVRQDLRAPPVTGKEENSQHAAQAGGPPYPVAGDSLRCNHAAHKQRSVSGKSCGHHGRAGQPPGDVAPGDKKFFSVAARATAVINANRQVDQQVTANHDPVNPGQWHKLSCPLKACGLTPD